MTEEHTGETDREKKNIHLNKKGGHLLGNWLPLFAIPWCFNLTHKKKGGNQTATAQLMVTRIRFKQQYFHRAYFELFPYVVQPEG